MTFVTRILAKLGILRADFDYHFIRASMVVIFLFFGYQKWFAYEAQALVPYISKGPLISWMYPPIHTERLGSLCWRVSSDDRDRCFSFEGSRSLGCIRVSAAAGCAESVTVH